MTFITTPLTPMRPHRAAWASIASFGEPEAFAYALKSISSSQKTPTSAGFFVCNAPGYIVPQHPRGPDFSSVFTVTL